MMFDRIHALGLEAPQIVDFVFVDRAVRAFVLLHHTGFDEAAMIDVDERFVVPKRACFVDRVVLLGGIDRVHCCQQ